MKLKYFKGVQTEQQAAEQYRSLAMQLHPDAGGTEEQWNAMVKEYQSVVTALRVSPQLARPSSGPRQIAPITTVAVEQPVPARESFGDVIRETGRQILGAVAITAIDRIVSTMGYSKKR